MHQDISASKRVNRLLSKAKRILLTLRLLFLPAHFVSAKLDDPRYPCFSLGKVFMIVILIQAVLSSYLGYKPIIHESSRFWSNPGIMELINLFIISPAIGILQIWKLGIWLLWFPCAQYLFLHLAMKKRLSAEFLRVYKGCFYVALVFSIISNICVVCLYLILSMFHDLSDATLMGRVLDVSFLGRATNGYYFSAIFLLVYASFSLAYLSRTSALYVCISPFSHLLSLYGIPLLCFGETLEKIAIKLFRTSPWWILPAMMLVMVVFNRELPREWSERPIFAILICIGFAMAFELVYLAVKWFWNLRFNQFKKPIYKPMSQTDTALFSTKQG